MISSNRLLRPSSEDNIVGSLLSKSATLSSPSLVTKPKINGSPIHNQPDALESKKFYAVPSRKPPRPPHSIKKRAMRSRTVDCIPIPFEGSYIPSYLAVQLVNCMQFKLYLTHAIKQLARSLVIPINDRFASVAIFGSYSSSQQFNSLVASQLSGQLALYSCNCIGIKTYQFSNEINKVMKSNNNIQLHSYYIQSY